MPARCPHAALLECQGLPRIGFTDKGRAASLLERLAVRIALRQQRLGARAVGLGLTGCRGEEPPALLDPARGCRHRLRALARWQRDHVLRVGLGQGRLGGTHGCGDTGDPLQVGLGALREMGFAREGTIGPQDGRARGRLPLPNGRAAGLANALSVTARAAEGFHQYGTACVVFHAQRHHDLRESGAMIAAIPRGKVHDGLRGGRVAVRAPLDMQARRIEGRMGRTPAQTRGSGRRHEAGEGGHSRGLAVSTGRPRASAVRGAGVTRGESRRAVGGFWQHRGPRGSACLIHPQPLRTIACTASPTVRSRLAGLCWVA